MMTNALCKSAPRKPAALTVSHRAILLSDTLQSPLVRELLVFDTTCLKPEQAADKIERSPAGAQTKTDLFDALAAPISAAAGVPNLPKSEMCLGFLQARPKVIVDASALSDRPKASYAAHLVIE